MWRNRSRFGVGLICLGFLALPLAIAGRVFGRGLRSERPQKASVHRVISNDGRDIVFAASIYQKSGKFYRDGIAYASHGSPDDETLNWVSQHLYKIRPDGTGRVRLTSGELQCESPKWSPNRRQIVFVGHTSRTSRHIYILNSNGSGLRRMTSGEMDDVDPEWSPRGNGEILFRRLFADDGRSPQHPGSVYFISAKATIPLKSKHRLRFVAESPPGKGAPSRAEWSPNGAFVAIQFSNSGQGNAKDALGIVRVSQSHLIVYSGVNDFAWSPDSRRLILVEDNKGRILNMSRGMTHVNAPVRAPHWLTSGRFSAMEETSTIREITARGTTIHISPITFGRSFFPMSKSPFGTTPADHLNDVEGDEWFSPSRLSSYALLCGTTGLSDGYYYDCYRVESKTGRVRFLRPGRCFAIAPSDSRCLISNKREFGLRFAGVGCGVEIRQRLPVE